MDSVETWKVQHGRPRSEECAYSGRISFREFHRLFQGLDRIADGNRALFFSARAPKAQGGRGEAKEMANAVISCRVDGNTVYIYDENGGICDVRSFAQPISNATAFGGGYSVTAGYLTFTFMLRNGMFEQTGTYQA